MTTRGLLLSAWDWQPSVVAGCLALVFGYLILSKREPALRKVWFLTGAGLLFLVLNSPLDTLADGYLFSAHVLQHFLLALVIPPLFLLGLPRRLVESALRHAAVARLERLLSLPALAWSLGIGTMLVWHLPALFNAALASERLHIFQHLTFLVTGTIFWWPVVGPLEERRLQALGAIAYLFTACAGCSLLGAALTFAPAGIYPAYLHPEDRYGLLPLIRTGWGLDLKSDQQLGGLLMWVPGCFIYLTAILANFARWYNKPEPVAVTR